MHAGTSRGPTPPLLFLLLDAAENLAKTSDVLQSAPHELNDINNDFHSFIVSLRASSRALRSSHSFRKHSVLREARARAACIPAYCKRLDLVERHTCGQPVCPWRPHRQRCLPALTCSHFARSRAEALHTAAGWPGPERARGFSPVATVRSVAVWHQGPRCSRPFCAAFSLHCLPTS